jgi:branched-subunit amino acid transport protein
MGDTEQAIVLITIAGMGLATYLPRALPLLLLARRSRSERAFSPFLEAWLRYVPPAVLAAMVLPSLLFHDGEASSRAGNLYLWAALPTLGVAWRTRSLLGAVLAGVAAVALARLLLR